MLVLACGKAAHAALSKENILLSSQSHGGSSCQWRNNTAPISPFSFFSPFPSFLSLLDFHAIPALSPLGQLEAAAAAQLSWMLSWHVSFERREDCLVTLPPALYILVLLKKLFNSGCALSTDRVIQLIQHIFLCFLKQLLWVH